MTFAALTLTASSLSDTLNVVNAPSFNAQNYCESRFRDYSSLSHEIAEAPRTGNIIDLGYCQLVGSCHVAVKGVVHPFKTPFQARAYVLRMFW